MDGGINPAEFSPWVVLVFALALIGCFAWIAADAVRGNNLPIAPALVAIALMGSAMWASYKPKPDEWAVFKEAHNCKVVGKSDGHSNNGVGVTTRGSVALIVGDSTPDKTGYLCDDGVTYWKNER
ncbi:hypothetical protein GIW79_22935 [Pseudomonas sp. PA-7-1E]|jgi:hypothetical protein|nr:MULTISPECIES: hypothetical protein [Gammaproteobacteria]EIE9938012.1 hypothetical protein [Escherichia coli]MBM0557850.1 hypothetical protein [Escherichia coli]MCF4988327.1 hypothetical protein [Pseudomonas gessardii]MCF5043308.1 hypothetical protein [Pseudomonas sp. PA-7-1E]MCF5131287.1 hypothetical protein [Pseudomonas sp. PA-6-4F]